MPPPTMPPVKRILILAGLILLCCTGAQATCTGVCSQASLVATATSGLTCAPTLAGTRTAGLLLIATVFTNSTTITLTVADTDGNTWVDDFQWSTTNGSKGHILSAKNSLGGSGAYTATITHSATITASQCWVAEFNFNSYTKPYTFDKSASAGGTAQAVSSGATPTLTTANELVISMVGETLGTARAITAGAGYTLIQDGGALAGTIESGWEYQNVASTTGIAGTFSLAVGTVAWDCGVATYYGTLAGGAPQRPLLGVGK